jgi:hypothetical protein
MHQRQKIFRIEDHIYYIKLRVKQGQEAPLLVDILEALVEGFNYILSNLRNFYDENHHNMAYMTLYQEPMVNGLNTGGFDIQENASEMVDRLLRMLNNFLISNQSMQVNETFKVYIKVLSIDHLNHKKQNPQRKKVIKKKFKPKHYGGKTMDETYNYFWAIDVPKGTPKHINVFENKCLLVCTILGLTQNKYYQSNRKDKEFVYMQKINSSLPHKKEHACKLILNHLNKMFNDVNLASEGPYDFETTAAKLSKFYKCQFFIFDSIDNSTKLKCLYPNEYDDSLQPIYLFEPLNNSCHLIFIRELNSYFRKNVKVCFNCKKTFKSFNYKHMCTENKVCFSCRRPFATKNTYLHEKLKNNFCDKNITTETAMICTICNVTIYSKHCKKSHCSTVCNGSGTFGWKCLNCKKFTYRKGNLNAKKIAELHKCGVKSCKFCQEQIDIDEMHICKLKTEKYPKSMPLLAFISMEHTFNGVGKCFDCFTLKLKFKNENLMSWKELYEHELFSSLNCPLHQNIFESEPNIAVIYKETKFRGYFDKYVLTDNNSEIDDYIEKSAVYKNYLQNNLTKQKEDRKIKTTESFQINREKLGNAQTKNLSLLDKIIQLLVTPEWQNTTFISQDLDSLNYVRIILELYALLTQYQMVKCYEIKIKDQMMFQ